MIEYPKIIYNKDGAVVRVESKEEHEPLKEFFSYDYNVKMEPLKYIPYVDALKIIKDVKKEINKPVEKTVEKEDINYKALDWGGLKRYAKQLGVKVPLRATREEIEKEIEGLDGNNDKRPNKEEL